ncbi:MAG TPA: PIN domain-containing protein [Solirubrobacteraceae bacterium]|nr:PIN domain-containing protein [Solirubrobacteraceae bacterium]
MSGLTLDAGALIAVERGDEAMQALLRRAIENPDATVNIPAGVLAQVVGRPSKQVRLMRLLRRRQTQIVELDTGTAHAIGLMLGLRGTRDVIDASVVVCARRHRQPIVTSDAGDLRCLDQTVELFAV